MVHLLCAVVLIIGLLEVTHSSPGDRDFAYQNCVRTCVKTCSYKRLDPFLRLLQWDCQSDCSYNCMMEITRKREVNKQPILQYHGKWPFVRVFGLQEPASVLFSSMNLMAVLFGWRKYEQCISRSYALYGLTQMQAVINSITWSCAVVYHARDTHLTEILDYLTASAMLVVSLFYVVVRYFGKLHCKWVYMVGVFLLVFFCSHSYKMSIRLDYGYNMKVMVSIALLNGSCWICWSLKHRKRRPYVWRCLYLMIYTLSLSALELFDFPPIWRLFDGHSLWHLATVPFGYLWYRFLIDDAKHEMSRKYKEWGE